MNVIQLHESDIDRILDLERRCFNPSLRASEPTLRKRFALKHIMLGIKQGEVLEAMISFSYSWFSPDEPEKFPRTFKEYSTLPASIEFNAAFGYNFEVSPDYRGKGFDLDLYNAGIQEAREAKCTYIVADVSSPSYLGSHNPEENAIAQNHEFKAAIDDCIQKGRLPTTKELGMDPLLRYYHRQFGMKPWRIIPNFYPEDRRSGGIGIIIYKQIT